MDAPQHQPAEENKPFTPEEISEMFNSAFLPLLQKIAKRKKIEDEKGDEYIGYQVLLRFVFPEQEEEIKLEKLEHLDFKLSPLIKGPPEEIEKKDEKDS